MKKILLLLFLFPTIVFAQPKNAGQNFRWVSEQWGIAPVGGQFYPEFNTLNDSLASMKGNDKDLYFRGLRGYGITAFDPVNISRGQLFDAAFSFAMFFQQDPVAFRRSPTDSLHFNMKGWHFMYSILGKDVIPGQTVALVLSPGWDFGMFKMIVSENGNGTKLTNGFIAPFGRAEMRFVFGPIVLGARGIYRYEITKDDWKIKSGPVFQLPGMRNTGYSIEFFVGWGHAHYN
ncbi:MAG TPA: hypothetical protein VL651_16450 [Bacteroidia bacterium]|jgi:hypothetical protein|nr:hypothetical protein [Bacteroidia bacterium]